MNTKCKFHEYSIDGMMSSEPYKPVSISLSCPDKCGNIHSINWNRDLYNYPGTRWLCETCKDYQANYKEDKS